MVTPSTFAFSISLPALWPQDRPGVFFREDWKEIPEEVPVGQAHVANLPRAPLQEVLDDAAQPDEHHLRRTHALEQVIHRGDAAVGVPRDAVESRKPADFRS